MKTKLIAGGAALVIAAGGYFLTRGGPPEETVKAPPVQGVPMVEVTLPETLSAEAEIGKNAFDAVCAACHGQDAAGKVGFGPPLVHKIYEPSHHGDISFVLAVQNGVRAHHWRFGDMPAQDGLTQADVAGIVNYVRELQRTNGIN
ncbi:c-type cytochrome [Antarctobacter heliothermus]|uniref:Cytochrome c n=1 Tax=Antarctobacter heliothermus TaxID=74033 RepID=A0A239BG22_9RHOB|nr:cytochrome c [Antarctobacter heliothermus]SNS06870.1 Cytochrome c [Antarctobacter heliothermus]